MNGRWGTLWDIVVEEPLIMCLKEGRMRPPWWRPAEIICVAPPMLTSLPAGQSSTASQGQGHGMVVRHGGVMQGHGMVT